MALGYNGEVLMKGCAMRFTTTRFVAFFAFAICAAALSGCAGYGVHKIDIQQGNLVTQEALSKVKPGMSKADVKNALGTPLVQDVFRANRWDYYFTDDRGTKYGPFGREKQKFVVTIFFQDEKVARIDGEASPIEILTGGGEKRVVPNTTPPGAPPPPKS
jgi:outer membrane protein assembly factor BamE